MKRIQVAALAVGWTDGPCHGTDDVHALAPNPSKKENGTVPPWLYAQPIRRAGTPSAEDAFTCPSPSPSPRIYARSLARSIGTKLD